MKHQTLICFIVIQTFIWANTLLGVEPAITSDIDDVAVRHAQEAMYIVDQAAPGAADTNPGTEEQPFKTVQHAADTARPGDTVYVMAGKYDEQVKVKSGGTEGKPVAFVAMPRRSVTVRGFDLEGSYIRVEGFEITADKPATAVQLRADHCEILDNYIHDMMVAVSGTVGKPSADGNTRDYSAVAHNRIAYNKVYHCEYGFILGGEDWLVENNEVSRLFMYASGNKYDDCDYSRFFGKGCIQRYNYYHGSTRQEIKTAHVDCLQTFTNNGEIAMNLLFEYNTCFDFHQMCMVESAPHIGSVRGWTFRYNIISANSPTMRGGWGPDIIQTLDVMIENCTISTVNWACIGLRGAESTNGQIRNNILCDAQRAVDDRMDFTPANPVIEYNLTFKTAPLTAETNIDSKDPLFEDSQKRNFRLKKGSPAIGAGRRRPHGLHTRQPGHRVQPDIQDFAAGGRDEHKRQGSALRGSPEAEFPPEEGQPGHRGGQGRRNDRSHGVPQRVLRRSSSPGRRG